MGQIPLNFWLYCVIKLLFFSEFMKIANTNIEVMRKKYLKNEKLFAECTIIEWRQGGLSFLLNKGGCKCT